MRPQLNTTCCVAGGGPAGMMLGYLLARQGVRVTVIEKHKDFFRDFRGDTVHPSTLDVFHELGLLDEFLKLPHQELPSVGGVVGGFAFQLANFRHVPAHCKFIALMPQWDLLNFLSSKAKKFPSFDLRMEHEATGLTRNGDQISGVQVKTPDGPMDIGADLVVGCDGRHAVTRQAGQLEVMEFGVPIDVLWFRISRREGDPEQALGNVNYGRALVLINRRDYFQAGLIVPKGSFEQIKSDGIEAFPQIIARTAPYLSDRVHELKDWEQVKLLTVQINRLRRWHRPGLLCIGDAAHAMSPAGGVGINLAIQDAVATANLLAQHLLDGHVDDDRLATVQRRRDFPTRFTQFLQINAHKAFEQLFQNPGPLRAPWQLKVAVRVPGIQHVMGRVVGMGVRPEHVAPRRHMRTGVRIAAMCAGVLAGIWAVNKARRWGQETSLKSRQLPGDL